MVDMKKAAQEAMIARQKAEAARPRTGNPQTSMPKANTVPNPQRAAMQKMSLTPVPLVGRPGSVPQANAMPMPPPSMAMRKGGSVAKASKRADGIAKKGKTKGRYI